MEEEDVQVNLEIEMQILMEGQIAHDLEMAMDWDEEIQVAVMEWQGENEQTKKTNKGS